MVDQLKKVGPSVGVTEGVVSAGVAPVRVFGHWRGGAVAQLGAQLTFEEEPTPENDAQMSLFPKDEHAR
jgi:hypothetical protein